MDQTQDELEMRLQQFSRTEKYHRFSHNYPNLVLTYGALFLAQQTGFWLMDAIGSHQVNPKVRQCEYQAWTLRVDPQKSALLVCADFDNRVLMTQNIDYTDFPLAKITLLVEPEGNYRVILLPSEH